MKLSWIAAITLLCAPLLCAQDDAQREGPETDRVWARFDKIDKVVANVSITDADVDAFVEHYPAFAEAMADDEKYSELLTENWKQAFDHAVTGEAFEAWYTEADVDGATWLRKAFRIRVLYIRDRMNEDIEAGRKAIQDSRARIRAATDILTEDQYKRAMSGLTETEAALDDLADVAESLPRAETSEAGVLDGRRKDVSETLSE